MIRKLALIGVVLSANCAWAAYDANGVALGASERDIARKFPSANCKPLEWASRAADRRCDDAKVLFGGVSTRMTFYLKQDKVQAFDVRFDSKDAERLVAFLKSRYGPPSAETRQSTDHRGKPRELYKVQWENGGARAVVTAQMDRRRASLTVSSGDFEDEIYRVR